MALGLDPRFDLRKAYWIVAGIAGGDPADVSLGSAAWAEWVVDGDLGHEIDAREVPAGWQTGFVPLRKSTPYEGPKQIGDTSEVFRLDAALVDWAVGLTRDVPLVDSEVMQKERAAYPEEAARRAPFVLKGDTLSSSTFWTGTLLDRWANDWVRYHTLGQGTFATTAMEDTGTLQSLTWLARAQRVDLGRVLVLRTVSNFDQPPPGMTAAEGLARTNSGRYIGFEPAIEAAYRVGNAVVDHLVANWTRYPRRHARGPALTLRPGPSTRRSLGGALPHSCDGGHRLFGPAPKFRRATPPRWPAGHLAGGAPKSRARRCVVVEAPAAVVLACWPSPCSLLVWHATQSSNGRRPSIIPTLLEPVQ